MSIEATNHVFKFTQYPPAQSYILLAIADVVNDTHDNRFFMTIKALAKKTKCSERTVQRALAQFVEDGWLSVKAESNGRGNPTEYQFQLVMGDNLTPIFEEKGDKSGSKRVTNEVSIHLLELNRTQVEKLNPTFEEFWKNYPRKDAKKDAEKAFTTIKAPLAEIMAGVKKLKAENRKKEFIPLAGSWLRGERWKDEGLQVGQIIVPTYTPPKFEPQVRKDAIPLPNDLKTALQAQIGGRR